MTRIYDDDYRELIKKRYGIIGNSISLQNAIDTVIQAAPTDLSILITGDTGTGKEVFAKAVHGLSQRANKPFLSVNCGAIPENLIESELFGHIKGAFTGATEQRIGFFESADTGTLFLDEIGELPIQTQVKLLRVLESGEYLRLGTSKELKVDVRVIAATNRDLKHSVVKGTFRQDLFFRLNSVHIILPSLRNHIEDIPLLVDFFGKKVCQKLGFKFEGFSNNAIEILQKLPWQGNIRELKNMVETIITLEKKQFISEDLLIKYLPTALPESKYEPQPQSSALIHLPSQNDFNNYDNSIIYKTLVEIKNDISDMKLGMRKIWEKLELIKLDTEKLNYIEREELSDFEELIDNKDFKIEDIEKTLILSTLKKYSGNRRKAAESLGISQRTIYRKLEEYGILD